METIEGANDDAWGVDEHGTWNLAWLGSTPTIHDAETKINPGVANVALFTIRRGFLSWDLTGISGVFNKAKIRLYYETKFGTNHGILDITEGLHVPPYTVGDFQAYGVTQDSFGGLDTSVMTLNQYNDWEINAAGLAFINSKLGANLYLGIRTEFDRMNNPPPAAFGFGVDVTGGRGVNKPLLLLWRVMGKNIASDLMQETLL